ncbi:tetratricopeptide repeat protein [Mesorhizobium sp. CA13]|uniref:tetratricopeptide repeat protein n=1 Tax=Mesorhizobium sp. CA13 TaxID=2876643 RepID=UPI001CCE5693|nr:tetratricopeptide repeat protein [Mesorhizobium sp. CA13]MBZ9854340.1 tetratricopeptide repeat protein [Mesorhizobium sp. CA13]
MMSWKDAGLTAAAIEFRALTTLVPSWWPLVALGAVLALNMPALAAEKDYATCIGEDIEPDKRIVACTAIAEDAAEPAGIRATAYFQRGVTLGDQKQYDRSIVDYSEVIALDPNDASAYLNRGADWFSNGDDDRAIADFNIVISLEPSSSDAYSNRGLAFLHKGSRARTLKGDSAGAAADCRRAIELDPMRAGSCGDQLATDQSKPALLPGTQQQKQRAVVPDIAATQDTLAARALEATDPRALEAILGGDAFLDMGKYD